MDADRFDTIIRALGAPTSTRRRIAIGGMLGTGLASLGPRFGGEDSGARKKKKRCRGGKKRCRQGCIPKEDCCTDGDCGLDERCTAGVCEPCLGQGTVCNDDDECCTGICDTYTNKCQQVRVECTGDNQCPGGQCCDVFSEPQCLYVTATQGACVPDGEPNASCGYVVCGDKCSDITDGTYEFCGFEGSAACRNGRCCCPRGIPLENCPSFKLGEEFLPRCPERKRKKRK
jgi:hypothetical protein